MEVREVFEEVSAGGWIAIFVIITTLVEISPIKINPWKALATWIGNALNSSMSIKLKDIQDKLTEVENKLDDHMKSNELEYVDDCRSKILDFAGETLRGIRHTREQYSRILDKIDIYEKYCVDHPKYPNSKCMASIAVIKRRNDEHMDKRDFLDSQGHDEV